MKQEGRSRLTHPSSWKYIFDGSYGMLWLTLGPWVSTALIGSRQESKRDAFAASQPL
jgi:hypothetical protein